MKTPFVLAASAVLAMSSFVAAPTAMAGTTTVPVDGSYCGFNANQIGNGFYCLATFDTTDISREVGTGGHCQDAQLVTVTYRSYNHRGNFMVGRTEVVDLGATDWGQPYDAHHGCHY